MYTELIMKKQPKRNVNAQNVYLYLFGVIFNMVAIFLYDYDAVFGRGVFLRIQRDRVYDDFKSFVERYRGCRW